MAIFLLVACVLILVLPRQNAIVPFLSGCFFIPIYQVVVLGSLHFSPIRILILVALARMIASPRHDKLPGGFTAVDKVVILWSVTVVIAFFLEFPGTAAVIQGLGDLVDTAGGFLAVRFLIPDGPTMRRAVKVLVVICVIQAVPMIGEQITHTNVYGYFTGMNPASTIRDGKVRASGTMGALTAGPFGGTLIPIFIWLWMERRLRIVAIAGLLGAAAMVIASNSSTSQLALLGSIVGFAFWRLRKRMRQVRWAVACVLVGLHLSMKAPVWALIARIDLTGSSSSWQRYFLVDMTIRHFSDWWLIGTPDFVNWGWGAWDTCNQFVDVAVKGGLLALIFFITVLSRSFAAIGRARKLVEGNRTQEWLPWCLGTALFGLFMAGWGINYSGMLLMGFYVLLAFITVTRLEASQLAGRTVGTHDLKGFAFSGSRGESKLWVKA
jgi:hypothetical protein